MNATEQAALLQSALVIDETYDAIDERTLEILDRRRQSTVIHRRGWLVRRALLAADVIGLAFAFLLAEFLFFPGSATFGQLDVRTEYFFFLLTLPIWVVVAKLYRLYDHDEERTDHSTVDDLLSVFHLVTVGTWIFFAASWLIGFADPNIPKLIAFWALAITGVAGSRGIARSYCRRQIMYLQNTLIVGAGEIGQLVARKFLHHPEYGINLVGFVDSNPPEQNIGGGEFLAQLGPTERLPAIVELYDIERVVIAFSNDSHEETLDLIRSLKDLDVRVDIVPRLFEIMGPQTSIHTVEGMPLVGLPTLGLSRSSLFLKRSMDIALAGFGLLVLAPIFAVVAWLVRFNSPGPAFFSQERMGAGNETFRILKFRTMQADAEERKAEVAHLNKHLRPGGDPRMFKVPEDPRITRAGRFLRRYSLDELPQLWNVLRGEMSIVGPRPLILDEDQHVDEWGRRRLDLKPGITGPWQVLGGTEIPFEEMLKLDYLYVTSWSLFTDLKLVLRTFPVLFRFREAF